MEDRIENLQLRSKIASPEEASILIQDGMTVGMSGYTSAGYPKAVAAELAKRKADGEELKINLVSGSTLGAVETLLGDIISRRIPMIESKIMSQFANQGRIHYVEQQMNKLPRLLRGGAFGKIDVAIIEAIALTKEGFIIPTTGVGLTPHLVEMADNVIIEINLAQPYELRGFHDIYLPEQPPAKKPIPLHYVNQRIGEPFIRINPSKIRYIVESHTPDETSKAAESTVITQRITDNLLNLLELEVINRWAGELPPIQTGIGNLASNIVRSFENSNFQNISFFCGGLQDANVELMRTGKVKAASAGSIQMTTRISEIISRHSGNIKKIMVLRNMDITNSSETIERMGLISLNSGIETDIYGNVNSSHIMGTKVVNGIGGGANFAQNAKLSVLLVPSETKNGDISTIVPMVSNHDIIEHDIDIIITEQGVADLRGKDDVERANCIIHNCASPEYKDMLQDYLKRAIEQVGGHHPHLLGEAFSWHQRFLKTGSMKKNK